MAVNPINELLRQFTKLYGVAGADCVRRIKRYIARGKNAQTAVRLALSELGLASIVSAKIRTDITLAAAQGFGVVTQSAASSVALRGALLSATWTPGEMILSDKLHAMDASLRNIMNDTVADGMRKASGARKIAIALESKATVAADLPQYMQRALASARSMSPYLSAAEKSALMVDIRAAQRQIDRLGLSGAPNQTLKNSYKRIINAVTKSLNSNADKALAKAVNIAVQEKARYYAERIARTEMARAYGVGAAVSAQSDSDVIGIRFSLSDRHPKTDICDFHTKADLYGMGSGVYPKNLTPRYPFHPHCTCVMSDIFIGEAEKPDLKNLDKRAQKFLRSQDGETKKALLGVRGSDEFKRNGDKWRKVLTNWNGHKNPVTLGLTEKAFKNT